MNYSDKLFLVEHLKSNLDTELYVITRREDGMQLNLHISGPAYRVIELNSDIQLFIEKQLEFGKETIKFLDDNTEVIIKSSDVENNIYKPLNEAQLKNIIDNALRENRKED